MSQEEKNENPTAEPVPRDTDNDRKEDEKEISEVSISGKLVVEEFEYSTEPVEKSTSGKVEQGKPITDTKKSKKKEKPPPKPVRSLTDAEYEEIFEAAINRVMNAPIEEETKEEVNEKEDTKDDFDAVVEEEIQGENKSKPEGVENKVHGTKQVDKDTTESTGHKKESSQPEQCVAKSENRPVKAEESSQQVPPKKLPTFTKKPKDAKLAPKQPKPKEKVTEKSLKRKIEKELFSEKGSQPKEAKKTKIKTKKTSSKDIMAQREVEEIGIWVQCSTASCNKWRHLKDVHDPTLLPEVWTCDMNTDPEQNSCEAKEADYDPETEHEDFIHLKYAEGSIVWARMAGYPWWPGLVEVDPDYQIFFECRGKPNIASHYHVVFLDEKVTRAWFGIKALRPFTKEDDSLGPAKARGQDFRKAISEAKGRACQALKLSLPERISQYGFASRFNGKWGILKENDDLSVEGSPIEESVQGSEASAEGGFGSLSEQEVDDILDNTEAMIESAHRTLIELLSQQDGDDYEAEGNPKKAKKRKTENQPKKTKKGREKDETTNPPKKTKKSKTEKRSESTEKVVAGEEGTSKPAEETQDKPLKTASKTKQVKEKNVTKPPTTTKPTKPKPFAAVKKNPVPSADKPKVVDEAQPCNSPKSENLEKTIRKIKGEAEVSTTSKESVVSEATKETATEAVKEKTATAGNKETVKKSKPKFTAPKITKVQKESPEEKISQESQPQSESTAEAKQSAEPSTDFEQKLALTPVNLDPLNLDNLDPLNLDLELNVNLPSEGPPGVKTAATPAEDSDADSANFEE